MDLRKLNFNYCTVLGAFSFFKSAPREPMHLSQSSGPWPSPQWPHQLSLRHGSFSENERSLAPFITSHGVSLLEAFGYKFPRSYSPRACVFSHALSCHPGAACSNLVKYVTSESRSDRSRARGKKKSAFARYRSLDIARLDRVV